MAKWTCPIGLVVALTSGPALALPRVEYGRSVALFHQQIGRASCRERV